MARCAARAVACRGRPDGSQFDTRGSAPGRPRRGNGRPPCRNRADWRAPWSRSRRSPLRATFLLDARDPSRTDPRERRFGQGPLDDALRARVLEHLPCPARRADLFRGPQRSPRGRGKGPPLVLESSGLACGADCGPVPQWSILAQEIENQAGDFVGLLLQQPMAHATDNLELRIGNRLVQAVGVFGLLERILLSPDDERVVR